MRRSSDSRFAHRSGARLGIGPFHIPWSLLKFVSGPFRKNSVFIAFGTNASGRLGRAPLPGRIDYQLYWRLNQYLMVEMVRRQEARMAGSVKQLFAPTVLVRSTAHSAGSAEDLGWRLFCPNLSIVPVDGSHGTMFDPPYLEPLAERFTASMQHALDKFGGRADATTTTRAESG